MLATKRISGHDVTLIVGSRYLATRPMDGSLSRKYDVSIVGSDCVEIFQIADLSYDDANSFLAEFNNGETTFHGRVWELDLAAIDARLKEIGADLKEYEQLSSWQRPTVDIRDLQAEMSRLIAERERLTA